MGGGVKCGICPRGCVFTDSSPVGFCRVRGLENPGYGMCTTLSVDPIEKKPLSRFRPGSRVLSTGPNGCNLTCLFCQNWHISQDESPGTIYVPPEELVELALSRSDGIAYTYSEPTIWYEYILDTAPRVRERGGIAVMVSNGYVNPGPLADLIGVTDAWNIDLKSYSDRFYRDICGGDLETVKKSIAMVAESHCHLELTWLLIPGYNDGEEEVLEAAKWVADTCGRKTPFHLSRYFPCYRMNAPATGMELLKRTAGLFGRHLDDVILGNV